MMGLQATAGKRKLEAVVATANENGAGVTVGEVIPAKTARWSGTNEILPTTTTTNNNNNSIINCNVTTSQSNTSSVLLSQNTPLPPIPTTTNDDCIARLRAVAIPGETSSTLSNSPPSTTYSRYHAIKGQQSFGQRCWAQHHRNGMINSARLVSSLLNDDDDDDMDDYDYFSDDDRDGRRGALRGSDHSTPMPCPPQGYQPTSRYPDYTQYQRMAGHHSPHQYYNNHQSNVNEDPFQTHYLNRAATIIKHANYWNAANAANTAYYNSLQQQTQTIKRDANGKSYLELGTSRPCPPALPRPPLPPPLLRCCDGPPSRWCNYPCYRQRRLAVLNLSMYKLARYRQCSDPSLHKSVLICNTLRLIEREMEAETTQLAAYHQQQSSGQQTSTPAQQQTTGQTCSQAVLYNTNPQTDVAILTSTQPPVNAQTFDTNIDGYERDFREITSASGRATPFPFRDDDGDDKSDRINWGSVLSLTSQTDLELYSMESNDSSFDSNAAGKGRSISEEIDWRMKKKDEDGKCDSRDGKVVVDKIDVKSKRVSDYVQSSCSISGGDGYLSTNCSNSAGAKCYTATSDVEWGDSYEYMQVLVEGS